MSAHKAEQAIVKYVDNKLTAEKRKEKKKLRRKKTKQNRQKIAAAGKQGLNNQIARLSSARKPRAEGNVAALRSSERMLNPQQLREVDDFARQMVTMRRQDGERLPYAVQPRMVPVPVTETPTELVAWNVPYLTLAASAIGATDPRIGLSGLEFYQDPMIPFRYWSTETLTGACTITLNCEKQDKVQGLWPSSPTFLDEGMFDGTMELDNADELNCVGLITYSIDTGQQYPNLCRKFVTSTGDIGYGIPYDLSAAGLTVTLNITTAGQMGIGANFAMKLVSKYGATAWTNGTALGAASFQYVSNFVFGAAQGDLGGRNACLMPDAPMGIRIRCLAGTVNPVEYEVTFQQATTTTLGRMKPYVVSYLAELGYIDEYSHSATNALVSFVGPTITASGSSVEMRYSGGLPACLRGYCGYDSVASNKQATVKPMIKGGRYVWKPSTLDDFLLRDVKDQVEAMYHPTGMIWIKNGFGSTNQSDTLVLLLDGAGESTTGSMTRGIRECVPNPVGLSIAVSATAQYPAWTENPTHWQDIKAWSRNVLGGVSNVAGWVGDHPWVLPAIKTAGMAALAMI